jgi:hypothetical protein
VLLLVPAQLVPMDSGKMVLLAMLALFNALLAQPQLLTVSHAKRDLY